MERGNNILGQNYNQKMITGEWAIGSMRYLKKLDKILPKDVLRGERANGGTWYLKS